MNELRDQVCAEKEYMINLRRDFHRHPELSLQERRTAGVIEQELERFEISHTRIGATGVLGILRGTQSGSGVVALRADIDALPIQETNDVEYRSQTDGIMHACGHDAHTASLLGAAKVLSQNRDRFGGELRFLFQPAEETTGGAKRVCESGVFERYHVTRIFGMHLWPDLPAGSLASRPGPLLARSSETTVTFHGVSSHIAKWRDGRDALGAAARFVVGSKWLSRKLEQDEPFLLRFGHMTAGTVRNAVAGQARVEGSLRVFSDDMFARAQDEVRALAQTADEEGCTFDLHFSEGYPPVVNDGTLFGEAAQALPELERVPEPLLIAEDFAFYQRYLPGVFFLLGTGTGIPLHADTFNFDERVLLRGVRAYQQLLFGV